MEAGLPSACKAHLEEKQHYERMLDSNKGSCFKGRRRRFNMDYNKNEGGKDAGKDLSVAPGWDTCHFLESV